MDLSEQHKLSAPEPAKYLGISTSTLSKLRVFAGGPAFLKFGRRVRLSADASRPPTWASIRGTGMLGRHADTGEGGISETKFARHRTRPNVSRRHRRQ
jgi:hypothetical protein